jgi:cell division septation protein DedD
MTPSAPNGTAETSWNNTTQVQTAAVAKKTAPLNPAGQNLSTGALAPSAPTPAATLKGKYKLQVAAVRTRAEADDLAQRLRSQYGADLGGREPLVDEAVIGGFGTLFRVRVGPYADEKEPNKLCNTIKLGGFDCLVVTQ